jgi:hypothetical protein
MLAPVTRQHRRSQAGFPLIGLSEFARPPVSTRSWLEADRDALRFTVGYTYRSVPNAVVRERSTPHDGVCFLIMYADNDFEGLAGIYYTERRTIGDVTLHRVSTEPNRNITKTQSQQLTSDSSR